MSAPDPALIAALLATERCGVVRGALKPTAEVAAVIDYRLPSTTDRLWLVDVATGAVLYEGLVAHGANTGDDLAVTFSNTPDSHQSSLGVFRTGEVYEGQHGRALRLDGLEPGFNDAARDREIVVHGAEYVSPDFIAENGRLGRSWGCPAVSLAASDFVIDALGGGALVLAWYPDPAWLAGSTWLHCE